VLLNVLDAVYMCYAMDKDSQQCTHLYVHDVMSQLPPVKASGSGPMVENPGGLLSYAQPAPSTPPYPQAMPQQGALAPPPASYPTIGRM
jgi:hypothetical protein